MHSLHEPVSYMEALCDPLWQGAMDDELTALHQTHTWDLVPLPAGKRAIGSRSLNSNLMDPLKDIRLDFLLKVILKGMTWIMNKHFAPVQK